jgi:hypothetical protein
VSYLFPDDLHQHSLLSAPVELPIKDLFPGSKIQSAPGHRNDDLTPHDLPLDVCVGVVFAGVVMPVLAHRLVRSDFLQPGFTIVMQS